MWGTYKEGRQKYQLKEVPKNKYWVLQLYHHGQKNNASLRHRANTGNLPKVVIYETLKRRSYKNKWILEREQHFFSCHINVSIVMRGLPPAIPEGAAQINWCLALRAPAFSFVPLRQTSLPRCTNKNAPLLSGARQ
jgi:hypothetical protein